MIEVKTSAAVIVKGQLTFAISVTPVRHQFIFADFYSKHLRHGIHATINNVYSFV